MAQRNAASGSKAGTAAKATAASARAPRSKAQQATSKTEQELRAERRASLIRRLAFSILLLFLTLFLVLSLVGVRAVFLDFLSMVFKGLLGYGTWILPAALLYIAWILFFLHEESIRGRVISTVLVVPAISALIHTLFCRIDFQPGFSILKSLWSTGTEMASGGVISGAVAQMLKALLSRAGAVPVLILAILVLAVFMLRLSPAKMIHNRAEKRREALSEMEAENPPQEEPEPYDTRADLRILATPVVRPKVPAERTADQPRRQRSFDLPFGGKIQQAHQLSLDELEAVSGGSDRNWLTDGCSATVEIGSWCWSDDTCIRYDVTYDNLPSHHCSKCGGVVVRNLYGYGSWKYDCIKCGDSAIVPIDTNDES